MRPNSLRACGTPFRQTAASQSTKLLPSAVQQPAPRACRRRRGHKGQYRERIPDSLFIKLIAIPQGRTLTMSQFRHKSCRPSASARLAAPAARGSGCGQRCRRTALLRDLTLIGAACFRCGQRAGLGSPTFLRFGNSL